MKWKLVLVLCAIVFSGTAGASINNIRPDNTAINKRDLNRNELTAEDQSNDKASVELARSIRRQVTKQNDLSLYAKNVKIIVRGSDVTLKGPVKNKAEKAKLVSIATSIAPNHRLHNQIVVTK